MQIPTGRIYSFNRAEVASQTWFWKPKIINYPVQGLGADLVAIGRVTMWRRLGKIIESEYPLLFVSTVHDSVDIDVNLGLDKPMERCYTICRIIKNSIRDIPLNFYRLFGQEFDLPIDAEIKYGNNLGQLEIFNE